MMGGFAGTRESAPYPLDGLTARAPHIAIFGPAVPRCCVCGRVRAVGWRGRGGEGRFSPLLCLLGNEGKWGEEGGGRVGRAAEASSTTDRAAQALTVEPWKRS